MKSRFTMIQFKYLLFHLYNTSEERQVKQHIIFPKFSIYDDNEGYTSKDKHITLIMVMIDLGLLQKYVYDLKNIK